MSSQSNDFQAVVSQLRSSESFSLFAKIISMETRRVSRALSLAEFQELIFQSDIDQDEFLRLVILADSFARDFDALRNALAIRLLQNKYEITDGMRRWIAGVLMGQIVRPKSKGGPDKAAGGIQRILVAELVQRACKHGLIRTRNVASEPVSACDAVVVALESVGYHTTYDAVSKSWSTHAQAFMKEPLD